MSPGKIHPYSSLPAKSFWRTAIAEKGSADMVDLWIPKFPLTKETRILTAGSCFAQHISNSLKEHGFNWIDAEPAPSGLGTKACADGGYGVFSFRTGNIYTARLLRQWLSWALGTSKQSTEVVKENGRYYDPFRPTIPVDGWATEEELLGARDKSLRAMRDAVLSADLFIFTLGLTEAWMNQDGFTYPLCPGTIHGDFSANEHRFHNFTYDEIKTDLALTFDEIREANPGIRFLLTVSPVPLTATASDEHVLVATTYSKAVLRAVAGDLQRTRNDVDYFPSFELITGHPFGGRYFEKNLRSVTPAGVDFVMTHFLSAIGGTEATATNSSSSEVREPALAAVQDTDVICEEIILETWHSHNESSSPPKILLIGDSQMGLLADAMARLGIPFAGGGIMWASQWRNGEFALNEEMLFTPADEKAKRRWQESVERCREAFSRPGDKSLTIITNVGMHCNDLLGTFFNTYLKIIYPGEPPKEVPPKHLHDYALLSRQRHWELLGRFVRTGHRVLCVSDPPVQLPQSEAACRYIDSILIEGARRTGCETFSARDWVSGMGQQGSDFRGDDTQHGNADYYDRLAEKLAQMLAIDISEPSKNA